MFHSLTSSLAMSSSSSSAILSATTSTPAVTHQKKDQVQSLTSSASSSSSLSSVASLLQSLVKNIDDLEVRVIMEICFVFFLTVRMSILEPILTSGTKDLKEMESIWDSRIERHVIKQFGSIASCDAAPAIKSKSCGPLIDAIRVEWKRRMNLKSLNSHFDYIDIFSSSTLQQWYRAYLDTFFVVANTTAGHRMKVSETIASAMNEAIVQWSTKSKAKEKSSDRILSTPKVCVDDFSMIGEQSLWLFVHLALQGLKTSSSLPVANKFNIISTGFNHGKAVRVGMDKLLSWIEQYVGVASATPTGGSIHHTCKFASCIEPTGIDMDSSSKYVSIRCTKGCASTFHVGCYYELSVSFVEKEDRAIPCWHAEERKCRGFIGRALLKHQGKFVSHLIMADGKDTEDDKVAYNDPLADDDEDTLAEQESDLASLKTDSVQANLPSAADARFWSRNMAKQFGRIVITDGAIMFKDGLAKMEMQQIKAEKKKREEEQAAVKAERKRLMEEKLLTDQLPKPVASVSSKKILNGFEVVVPMTKGDEDSEMSTPILTNRIAKSSWSNAANQSRFSALLSDDESEESLESVDYSDDGFALNGISVKRKVGKVKQQIDPEMAHAIAESKASEKRRRDEERAQRKREKRLQKEIEKRPEGVSGENSEEEEENEANEGSRSSSSTQSAASGLAALIQSLSTPSGSAQPIPAESPSSRVANSQAMSSSASLVPVVGPRSDSVISTPYGAMLATPTRPMGVQHTHSISSDTHTSVPSASAIHIDITSSAISSSALILPETDGFPNITAASTSRSQSASAASSSDVGVTQLMNARLLLTSSSSSASMQSESVTSMSLPQPAVTPPPASPPVGPLYQLVEDIVECHVGSRSSIVLIRNLPLDVSIQMVGKIFCAFGKLKVHFVFTKQHGLTGIIQYLVNEEHAMQAIATLSHRIYQFPTTTKSRDVHTGGMNETKGIELWKIGQLVYAAKPLQTTLIAVPDASQLKLISCPQS